MWLTKRRDGVSRFRRTDAQSPAGCHNQRHTGLPLKRRIYGHSPAAGSCSVSSARPWCESFLLTSVLAVLHLLTDRDDTTLRWRQVAQIKTATKVRSIEIEVEYGTCCIIIFSLTGGTTPTRLLMLYASFRLFPELVPTVWRPNGQTTDGRTLSSVDKVLGQMRTAAIYCSVIISDGYYHDQPSPQPGQ